MTPRQIAALAVRVLALYCIVSSLSLLSGVAITGYQIIFPPALSPFAPLPNDTPLAIALAFSPFVLHAAFGVFLWIFADALAAYMAPHGSSSLRISITPTTFAVVFITTGIWFIADSVPRLLGLGIASYFESRASYNDQASPETVVELVAVCVQLGIGIWLVFGARGLVRWLRSVHPLLWLRNLGRDPALVEESRAD